ncbi:MAG: GGDEF domain-containing protein [Desulfobulbaceae bacterium]|nr:GGDEF domain-containing protein [Desulfobulbaceae bacterium]
MFFIGEGLVFAGTIGLILALFPLAQLLRELPKGTIRSQWRFLGLFICLFITGYICYGIISYQKHIDFTDLVVPVIFFCGAVFVYIVCYLSLNTAKDLVYVNILKKENITDPLMGVFNRRFLECRLKEEIQRANRIGQPLSIFILDIDYFKNINDSYGHQIGDQLLKELAQILIRSLRASDLVVRYGGDEVLCILPNTNKTNSRDLAERVRQLVEEFQITLPAGTEDHQLAIGFTVSIGVTGLSKENLTYKQFINNADKALYLAKKTGRNRVVVDDSSL